MTEETSRRAQQRHDLQIQVELTYEGQAYPAVSRNISLGGMFLQVAVDVPFGAVVKVSFALPDLDGPVQVEGHVRWVQPEQGIGVQYGGLRAREVWALQQLFAKVAEPA